MFSDYHEKKKNLLSGAFFLKSFNYATAKASGTPHP
jgi:hypothetical protein